MAKHYQTIGAENLESRYLCMLAGGNTVEAGHACADAIYNAVFGPAYHKTAMSEGLKEYAHDKISEQLDVCKARAEIYADGGKMTIREMYEPLNAAADSIAIMRDSGF